MDKFGKAFDFNEDDLIANRDGFLSVRQQQKFVEIELDTRMDYKLGIYFLIVILSIVVIVLFVERLYRISDNNQPYLVFALIVIALSMVCLVLALNLPNTKPKSKSVVKEKLKSKKQYYPVSHIQGQARFYIRESSRNLQNIGYRVRISNQKEELAFVISQHQYDCLENNKSYIVYFANSQIVSLEAVDT